jgi:succinate dehydrogenase / fumarate reductase iron-sulfur subunit
MSKFPAIRDLQVDRSKMFSTLKKVKAWIPLDGTHNLGPGPKTAPELAAERYDYSTCMTCGCCCEACPQFKLEGPFMGAFSFGQVHLFNEHPVGQMQSDERLDAVMDIGGLVDCGNAQNCVAACPKGIPLANAIAELGWDTTKRAIKKMFKE